MQAGTGVEVVRAAVLGELGQRGRWLLVFDNAEDPADIRPWLLWTDRGNGPAAAGFARYLQFLLADGIRDAATAQVTVTADQD